MIEIGFYFFEKGSIGELRGYKKIPVTQQDQQHLLDNNTRERLNTFNPPPGLSPTEYSGMFLNAFAKARNETQNEEPPIELFVITVQIGNSESINEVSIIEKNKLFSHWENPEVVNQFKEHSKNYLNE